MKDAKGHGSNARGGASRVVKDTSVAGATHALMGSDGKVVARLYTNGSPAWREDSAAANELARGNPKAAAAPVHSGALGWKDHVAAGRSNFFGSDGKPLIKPGSIL